ASVTPAVTNSSRAPRGIGLPGMRSVFTPLVVLLMLSAVALVSPSIADAELADEQALGERFAPVVRLVEQAEECGPGEPFQPTDVDVLFDEPSVALRGPWNPTDLIKIGPSAEDLVD